MRCTTDYHRNQAHTSQHTQATTASQHAYKSQAMQDNVQSLRSQLISEQALSEKRGKSLETMRNDLQTTLGCVVVNCVFVFNDLLLAS